MKKVVLLCMAALCFCAAGLFAACNGPENPADTGGESQIEQPNGEQPQDGHAGSENTEESEQPQGGNVQDEEQKEDEPGEGGAISDQGGTQGGDTGVQRPVVVPRLVDVGENDDPAALRQQAGEVVEGDFQR